MNAWKVILATLVIFGTGVVTGGLLVAHSDHVRARHNLHPAGMRPVQQVSNSAGGLRFEFLRRAQRELNLTGDQQAQVDKLLTESQDHTRGMLRDEVQKTKEQFREVLTADQQARFDEILKLQQRAREQRRSNPGRQHGAETLVSSNAPPPVR